MSWFESGLLKHYVKDCAESMTLMEGHWEGCEILSTILRERTKDLLNDVFAALGSTIRTSSFAALIEIAFATDRPEIFDEAELAPSDSKFQKQAKASGLATVAQLGFSFGPSIKGTYVWAKNDTLHRYPAMAVTGSMSWEDLKDLVTIRERVEYSAKVAERLLERRKVGIRMPEQLLPSDVDLIWTECGVMILPGGIRVPFQVMPKRDSHIVTAGEVRISVDGLSDYQNAEMALVLLDGVQKTLEQDGDGRAYGYTQDARFITDVQDKVKYDFDFSDLKRRRPTAFVLGLENYLMKSHYHDAESWNVDDKVAVVEE